MLLVVGLGNPGSEYEHTRHNVGFVVLDRLRERFGLEGWRRQHRSLCAKARIGTADVLLQKPQTYMNLSGEATGSAVRFFKLAASEVIVVHDELDFAAGLVRLKPNGGHGGHNGLRNLIQHIGPDFARVRLGIGKPRHAGQGVDFVLGAPKGAERVAVDEGIAVAAEAVESIAQDGLEAAMGKFNRR